MNKGLLKYQAEQRAKKAAKLKGGKGMPELSAEEKAELEKKEAEEKAKAEAEAEAKAKVEAAEAEKKAMAAGQIKCKRCGLVFEKGAAKEVQAFGGRLGCPECGFPIPQ